MHNVLTVHEVEREKHLVNHIGCLRLCEHLLLISSNVLHEVAAGQQLCDDIEVSAVFHKFKNAHDVRVLSRL